MTVRHALVRAPRARRGRPARRVVAAAAHGGRRCARSSGSPRRRCSAAAPAARARRALRPPGPGGGAAGDSQPARAGRARGRAALRRPRQLALDARLARTERALARAARARRSRGGCTPRCPDVPIGVGSLTNRVLPYLFATSQEKAFQLALDKSYGIERPPPEVTMGSEISSFDALDDMAQEDFFSPAARKRAVVVLSDAETLPFRTRIVEEDLRHAHVKLIVVRFWRPDERVYGRDGLPERYVPTRAGRAPAPAGRRLDRVRREPVRRGARPRRRDDGSRAHASRRLRAGGPRRSRRGSRCSRSSRSASCSRRCSRSGCPVWRSAVPPDGARAGRSPRHLGGVTCPKSVTRARPPRSSMSVVTEQPATLKPARQRARGPPRAAPRRAHGLLLPHARLAVRGRGRGAGDVPARVANYERFEGRASVRSWLYRIATNVCLDMLEGRERRARPMDLGPGARAGRREPERPARGDVDRADPGRLAPRRSGRGRVARETLRLAFVAALQHLPPRQRAVLILCEVLRWKATEVAELLETSVASVNSALQRARATLETADVARRTRRRSTTDDEALLARYVDAFERYDIDALTALIQEDATQSMPPFDLWLRGRDDILTWWFGPGIGCQGSRVVPTVAANGSPAFGQYKPAESGEATSRGRCRCSRSQAGGSPSSRSSSTPRRCSRSSGCRSSSTPSARRGRRSAASSRSSRRGVGEPQLEAASRARRAGRARARRAPRGRAASPSTSQTIGGRGAAHLKRTAGGGRNHRHRCDEFRGAWPVYRFETDRPKGSTR